MAKFKTRARTVDMLGRQQIAGVPTAISELFKNAHDAYADHVQVDYFRSDGLFVLRDDGIGMTQEDFEERWLTLGTESKLPNQRFLEPPYEDPKKKKRSIAGEKGIGRLAIAAIGPQVIVMTRAERDDGLHDLVAAFIHWGLFALPGINVEEIEIPVRTFAGGKLPSSDDLQDMITEAKRNVEELSPKVDSVVVHEILADLGRWQVDLAETVRFLGGPTLEGTGRGTHFFILPATETLADDLDAEPAEGKNISRLRRLLLGFSNTMLPGREPVPISTAFQYWRSNDRPLDLLDAADFWTPEEFRRADHCIEGRFDEFGRFAGSVSIYDQPPEPYSLPWHKGGGRPTDCGPFDFSMAYVQGEQRKSRLPPDEFAVMNSKLERIGGLYIYRDGIRILPYGDADFDFLEIEKRRTLGASYYFFSYRRMFGAIAISREQNPGLVEKAGREGFQENKAYREFRDILMDFLKQLAAEYFREGRESADVFSRRRREIERAELARREIEKTGGQERRKLAQSLDLGFERINSGEPKKEAAAIVESLRRKVADLLAQGQVDLFGDSLLNLEAEATRQLESLKRKYGVGKPEGVGLTEDLYRDWLVYSAEVENLNRVVFSQAEMEISEIVSEAAHKLEYLLDRKGRIERLLHETVDSSVSALDETIRATGHELDAARSRVAELLQQASGRMRQFESQIGAEIADLDVVSMTANQLDAFRQRWQQSVAETSGRYREALDYICAQLRDIRWTQDASGYVIGSADMKAVLEEEVLALRDKAEAELELVQIGMAIEVINHEFNTTIRSIRASIRQLRDWASSNSQLRPLYQDLRTNFEHLDSYLTLFTPLHRRLYRSSIDVSGAEIEKYLRDLFGEALTRSGVELVASPEFREIRLHGYPSTFYPVFVNLVDNAIFWLKDRAGPKEIHLEARQNDLVVRDTGPGVAIRDREAIFEMGFTRKPGGRGLGLYISREVLKREGYLLELATPVEGAGAEFRIIPAASTPES